MSENVTPIEGAGPENPGHMTFDKALAMIQRGIPWLQDKVESGHTVCHCGACYICAYYSIIGREARLRLDADHLRETLLWLTATADEMARLGEKLCMALDHTEFSEAHYSGLGGLIREYRRERLNRTAQRQIAREEEGL